MDKEILVPLEIKASGRAAWVCTLGGQAPAGTLPLVVMAAGEDAPGQLAQVLPPVRTAVACGRCRPFALACFTSEDWDRDYSPWPAPALFAKSAPFAGGAPPTLAFVEETLLPAARRAARAATGPENTALIGYSLAGLFALWALYAGGPFRAAASCSGSLWFEGWADFMARHPAPPASRVYLSLGEGEEKARNPRMAAVGDLTRRAAELLDADDNLAESTLRWHPGGHFHNVPQRLADGLLWLMKP